MRCPTLAELPPPPAGRTGWPWTVESARLPDAMSDGRPWPRISIVTPSYSQGKFIEETIRSVLLQGYPNLEYVIVDGGSKDNTLSILRKYGHAIHFWTSAPDNGQGGAINKGFAKTNGEILAWLNSDDVYEMGVFAQVANFFQQHPDIDVVSGRCRHCYSDGGGRLLNPSPLRTLDDFLKINTNWMNGRMIAQPEAFFRSAAFELAKGIREQLVFSFDACLWIDMAKVGCKFASLDRHWANFRIHDSQKTADLNNARVELARVAWDQLQENWTRVENARVVANDIFSALDYLFTEQQALSRSLLRSTSYRVGRVLTKTKFW